MVRRSMGEPKNDQALERRVAELSSALEERTRQADTASAEWRRLEAELAEAHKLLANSQRPMAIPLPTPGFVQRISALPRKLRCPRCGGPMTEYTHQIVRADRCDDCSGIFFDVGELELVIAQTIEERDHQWQLWGPLFKR